MLKKSSCRLTILLIGFILTLNCDAGTKSGVTVSARQEPSSNSRAAYHYKVTNNNEHSVVGLVIGYDYDQGNSDLLEAPAGWSFKGGIPSGNSSSPDGWYAYVVVTEESPYMEIEWRNDGEKDIPPGITQPGFSVMLSRPDPSYLTGHWTVFFSDATAASGKLSIEGATGGAEAADDLHVATHAVGLVCTQCKQMKGDR